MTAALRCCPACHLLQSEPKCSACGEPTASRADAPTRLLYDPQSTHLEVDRPLGFLRGLGATVVIFGTIIVGGIVWASFDFHVPAFFIYLWCGLGLGSTFAFGLFRRPTPKRLLHALPSPRGEGELSIVGIARALGGGAPKAGALVRSSIASGAHGVYLRELSSTQLVVDDGRGREVLVAGALHVIGDGETLDRKSFGDWAQHLPAEATCSGLVIKDGDRVEVIGEGREEQITEGYRDRKIVVLRGDGKKPVVLRKLS